MTGMFDKFAEWANQQGVSEKDVSDCCHILSNNNVLLRFFEDQTAHVAMLEEDLRGAEACVE